MPVTNLRFNITSSWDGNGLRAAARSLGSMRRDTDRANRGLMSGRGHLRGWMIAAGLLAPALVTLGKQTLALAGGITTLAVVAGAAAAPWIGLAITAARNADKMGSAGTKFQQATQRVENAWMGLARRTASVTLGPMTDVLNGVAKAIPKLEPLVRDIAPVFADMGRSIRDWLSGRGFERFLQNVRDYGVPAFRNLVAAGKDFLATSGIGFRAFLPLAVDISEALRRGSANLRQWAEGGGFDRFLRDVRREWPTVKRFLDEAGTSAGKLMQTFDRLGPGELKGLSNILEQMNKVDIDGWQDFLLALASVRVAGGLLSLLGGLANIRGGQLNVAGGASLLSAASALTAAGGILNGAAAALSGAAAALSSALASGVAGGIGGILGGIGARLAGGSATFTITINPSDAADRLARIRDVLNSLNGKSVTATARLNAGGFTSGASAVLSAWNGVRAASRVPAVFRALAFPGNVPGVAAALIAAWARVRAAAAVPAVFRATASPGNVASVASTVVSAWTRVRAAAANVPVFRATASPGNVPGVASTIVGAWARVRAAAAVRPVFTAIVIPGPAVAGAAAVVAAWLRVLAMPRSWTASARVNAGPAVSGANAARSAWQSVLSMPRSVTFTVNIKTNKKADGGPAGFPGVPKFAGGGRVYGPGGPRSDRIPTMLSNGEWVIRAAAVKHWGNGFLSYINAAGPGSARPSAGGSSMIKGSEMSSGSSGGGDVAVHFHGKVYATSDIEFETMVASAMKELKRKGRLVKP